MTRDPEINTVVGYYTDQRPIFNNARRSHPRLPVPQGHAPWNCAVSRLIYRKQTALGTKRALAAYF